MNTIETLYESGRITDEEMDKLSSLREGLITSIEDGPAAVVEFVKEAFSGCSIDDLEKMSEMIDSVESGYMLESDDMQDFVANSILSDAVIEKVAGETKLLERAAKVVDNIPGLKYIAAASLGLPFAVSMLGSVAHGINILKHPFQEAQDRSNTKRMSQASLAGILKDNPELKSDKQTIKNFEVLQRYAPQTVATNRPLAEVMLKKMQQWGGVDPQSLQQMINMEKQHIENVKTKSMIPETNPKIGPASPEMVGALFG